jgi:hypothetical protein
MQSVYDKYEDAILGNVSYTKYHEALPGSIRYSSFLYTVQYRNVENATPCPVLGIRIRRIRMFFIHPDPV